MFGTRGQEAAPFELLVAVIVMGFVLLAGINVMGVLQQEECKGQLDSQLEKIKTAIESVASGEGQKDFSFQMPDCFRQQGAETEDPLEKTELFVRNVTSKPVCASFCGGARIECLLVWFRSEDHHNVKCLRVSTVTNFPDATICDDFSPDEYEAKNLKETIDNGQYLLVRKFDLSSQNADICAYKRVI